MQVSIRPSIEEIRARVDQALGAFETLPPEAAIHICKCTLQSILQYIDLTARAKDLHVFGVSEVGGKIRLERPISHFKATDKANVEVSMAVTLPEPFKKKNLLWCGGSKFRHK